MGEGDEQLISNVARQDADALAQLIAKYAGVVTVLVGRILGQAYTQWDIEECVSDAFVRLWQSARQYDPNRSTARTWLLMIAKYTALDYRRKHHRQLETESPTDASTFDDSIPRQHIGASPVEQAVVVSEAVHEMKQAISTLGDIDQQILYRRFLLYESSEQIAQALGISIGAVDNRLWRIRRSLKKKLHDKGEGDFQWINSTK